MTFILTFTFILNNPSEFAEKILFLGRSFYALFFISLCTLVISQPETHVSDIIKCLWGWLLRPK